MQRKRYYWARETNGHGVAVGEWQPVWLDADGNWWPRTIPGWVSHVDFVAMFAVHPFPLNTPPGK